jgi:hypothetical protein
MSFLCAKNGIWCQGLTYGTMDQRTICLYLNRKGLSLKAIHDELVQVLGSDIIAYSTVTSYLRASRWRAQNEEQHSDSLPMLSTTQFSKPLIKLRSRQYENSQSPRAFHVQRFGDRWRALWICRQALTLGSPSLDRCAMTNSNRSVKRIAQTLRVCTGQWLAKFYDLGWVLVLFVDKPRKGWVQAGQQPPERVKHTVSQPTH